MVLEVEKQLVSKAGRLVSIGGILPALRVSVGYQTGTGEVVVLVGYLTCVAHTLSHEGTA